MAKSTEKIQRQQERNQRNGIDVDFIYTSSSDDESQTATVTAAPAVQPKARTFLGVWETVSQYRERQRMLALERKRLKRYEELVNKINTDKAAKKKNEKPKPGT